jgi:hypothetical protein
MPFTLFSQLLSSCIFQEINHAQAEKNPPYGESLVTMKPAKD